MVEADFSGNFLNPENSKQNDVGVVIGEGEYQTKKNFKGQEYQQLVMDVEVNGKKLTHNPKTLEGKELVRVWGKDTKKWIGKQFSVDIIKTIVMGQQKTYSQIAPLIERVE